MEVINKIGGIILDSKKILVVRKRLKDNIQTECIIPGGKKENGESDEETLRRELKEELNVDLVSLKYFNTFNDVAVFEKIPINMKVYFAEINGEICPQNEIKEFIWIDKNYEQNNIKLGTILSKYVIPSLVDLGLM